MTEKPTDTENTGTYSMQLELELTVGECRKLAHIVHVQASDPSDVVSNLVATAETVQPRDIHARALSMRVYMLPERRSDLVSMADQQQCSIDELVSAMVANELALLPDITERPAASQPEPSKNLQKDLQLLKARRMAAGTAVPPWLDSYITQLDQANDSAS